MLRAGASSYESLIRARILDPLRMDDTVIAIPSRLAANVASGHDDSLDPTSDWTFDVLAGTGALRSTMPICCASWMPCAIRVHRLHPSFAP